MSAPKNPFISFKVLINTFENKNIPSKNISPSNLMKFVELFNHLLLFYPTDERK